MTLSTPLGDFGPPPDAMAWGALVLAAAVLLLDPRAVMRFFARVPDRVLVAALAVLAAAVSFAYVAVYLRGGPRIIDATTYYLQARALSEGHVVFGVPSPTASFRGRFLLSSADGRSLAGIFPPGYPALLALGFLVHAPLAIGPLLAAALVVATYVLGLRLFAERPVALLAAALSGACAVLRYHTADTMSHGLSALLFAVSVAAASGRTARGAIVAGACAGWLFATRPVTGVVGLGLSAALMARQPRHLALFAVAALGPVALFVIEQRVATSAWFESTQAAYYAVADGPPGCFRYGFGAGIGCVFEHGDFVQAHLSHGYGVLAAVGTTSRRLKMHLADAGNTELFAPVLGYALFVARRERRARLPVLAILAVMGAYVPFYFDGNYPGGGARFYADVLPFEHVLIAFAMARLGWSRAALPLALAGFALHTAYDHERLAEREGGRPLFEDDVVRRSGVTRGLVFVDTDHGFGLAFDPGVTNAHQGVVFARRRHDAHDALLWEQLGRPEAYAYETSLAPRAAAPRLTALELQGAKRLRFEAEGEWPPLAVMGGSAMPSFPSCASAHRALSLEPSGDRVLRVRLEVPVPSPGKYRIDSGWVTSASGSGTVMVTIAGNSWSVALNGPRGGCQRAEGPLVEMQQATNFIDIIASSEVSLDYLEVTPVGAHLLPD